MTLWKRTQTAEEKSTTRKSCKIVYLTCSNLFSVLSVVEIAKGRLSISKRSGSSEMEKLFAGFDAKPSEFEYNENQVTILSQKSTMPTRITGVLQTSLHQRRQTSARESLPSNRIRIEQTFSARLIKCLKLRQKRSAQFFSVEDTHGLQVSSVEGKQTKGTIVNGIVLQLLANTQWNS